ncbi:MAG: hypothetical protein R6V67_05505 [Spirochaetia bacterium]
MDILDTLEFADFPSYLSGFSALERYFSMEWGEVLQVETEGSIVDLSRLFVDISFPGPSRFDAVLEHPRGIVLFRCIDDAGGLFGGSTIGSELDRRPEPQQQATPGERQPQEPQQIQQTRNPQKPRFGRTLPPPSPLIARIPQALNHQGSLLYDIQRRAFVDRQSVYYRLRDKTLASVREFYADGEGAADFEGQSPWDAVFEAALIVARLGYEPSRVLREELSAPGQNDRNSNNGNTNKEKTKRLPAIDQRFLLSGVLTGKWAGRGLRLLEESGFIDAHWPLLSAMDKIDHSKEHHPEGNVWRHTVEAFAYRKVRELPLSLGLLLHDSGKPFTGPHNGNAFDRHAQIGADKAGQFLSNLRFDNKTVEQVDYFVRNHMLPSYIPKLPFSRTEDVLSSPLFPELLELYRCDVSSTFRGPDGYYRACATYRNFLKNRRNPFRSSDGKKRLRMLVD